MGFDAVALVSGGKDSVMAAMMAQSYGHDIVALANLLPADGTIEELDSHCFQTVGHRAVGVYHELTGLPLFRRKIGGTSAHVEMSYDVCDERVKGDEVEDLRALLAAVVREMPNVKAVTSGAILSDYQRLRVEAVCADLGLVSLAYLWRQPQGLMLETICDSDVDAVLCKVAAMGLVPKRDLGRTLADARETLYTIEQTYGSHCCGEGGEFETITMDCPLFRRGALRFEGPPRLWSRAQDPFAPSAHLAIAAVAVDVKDRLIEPGRLVDVDDAPPPPPQTRRRTIDAFQEVLTTEQGVIGGNQRLTKSWRRAGPSFWTVAAAVPVSGPTLPRGPKRRLRGPRRRHCTSRSCRFVRTGWTGATWRSYSCTSGTCRTSPLSTRRTRGWCRRPSPRRARASNCPYPKIHPSPSTCSWVSDPPGHPGSPSTCRACRAGRRRA
jgi:diphthine-ammonia ligase